MKLPRSSVEQTSGAFLEFFLLEGVRHIFSRARMMHKQAKVVIISSYGFYGGPHDGASQIERALDAIIGANDKDLEVVLPSGNGRRQRPHTRRAFDTDDMQEIKWDVQPDDRTPSVMEIWSDPYPAGVNARLELSIETPDGTDSAAANVVLEDDQTGQIIKLEKDGAVIAQAVCVHPVLHPGRRLFLIWMQPTALAGPSVVATPASSGIWKVRLKKTSSTEALPVSVWIRRDDSLVGFASGGRQSDIARDRTDWKDNPNLDQANREIVGDLGTAQRSNTISKIATGGRTVIVGGFAAGSGDRFPAPDSAGGPTAPFPGALNWTRKGPDALAPSEIFGDIGLAAAGFFGGGKVRFRGTSVAAPLVAMELARAIPDSSYQGGRAFVATAAGLSENLLPPRAKPSDSLGGSGRYITRRMRNRAMSFEQSS